VQRRVDRRTKRLEAYPPIDRKARPAGQQPPAANPGGPPAPPAEARNGSPPDPAKDAGP